MTQVASDWAWVVSIAALNGAAGFVFIKMFRALDLKSIVSEKAGGYAGDNPRLQSSSARVISFFGGMIMTFLVWGMANVAIFKGLSGATEQEIAAFLTPVGGFLVSGLTLFAPYAINQASDAFKTGQTTPADLDAAVATERQKSDAAIAAAKEKSDAAIAAEKAKTDAVTKANAAKQVANTEVDTAVAAGQLDAAKAKTIVDAAIKAATGTT